MRLLPILLLSACSTPWGGTWYAVTFTDGTSSGACPNFGDTADTTPTVTSTFVGTTDLLIYAGEGDVRYLRGPWGTIAGTEDKGDFTFTGITTSHTVVLEDADAGNTKLDISNTLTVTATLAGSLLTGSESVNSVIDCSGPECATIGFEVDVNCTTNSTFEGSSTYMPTTISTGS